MCYTLSELFTAESRPGCWGCVVFLCGILHFPSWVTVCIPLMLPLSWKVILQWSYWSHSLWRTWTWPCPSSWPSCVEGGNVGCGKQEDCEPCLVWGAGNTMTTLSPVPRSQPSGLTAPPGLVRRSFQQLGTINAAGRICPKTLPQVFHGFCVWCKKWISRWMKEEGRVRGSSEW